MYSDFLDFGSMHKKLQELMKKELCALRTILDLLKEEELAYMTKDLSLKKNLFLKKNETNKGLKQIQKERCALTKSLAETFAKESKTYHFNSSVFNHLISKDHENSVETFHLRDQILHFMKTIRFQKERLLSLKNQPESRQSFMPAKSLGRKAIKKPHQIQTIPLESPSSQDP